MTEIGWVWSLLALIPLSLLAVALWLQYRSGQCCANATIVVPCCCCGLESGRQRSGRGGGGGAGSAWLASFLTIYACAWLGLMLGLHSSSAEERGGQRLQQQPERLGGPGSAPGPSGAAGGGSSGPAEPPPAESLNALFYGIWMEPRAYQPIHS
jgi:hypothetical protein